MDARAFVLADASPELLDANLAEELGWLHRLACRLMADVNDADDLVQEAWLKAHSAPRESFASRSQLRAWLAAVTRRLARDTRRARRRREQREERAAQTEVHGSPADVVERSALLEWLLRAVRALEEPYRTTVLLRYMDGYATAEVAAVMSVSEEVVRKRLSRALLRLRGLLSIEWGDALPAGIGESPGAAPRGASPRFATLGRRAGASLGLVLLALALGRSLPSPAEGRNRTAPESTPSAHRASSSSEDSGAALRTSGPAATGDLVETRLVETRDRSAVEQPSPEPRDEPSGGGSAERGTLGEATIRVLSKE